MGIQIIKKPLFLKGFKTLWGFTEWWFGGGGGNWTRVRKLSALGTTCVSH